MRLIRLYNSFYTGVMSTAFYVSVCLIRTIHYLTLHSFGKCFSPKQFTVRVFKFDVNVSEASAKHGNTVKTWSVLQFNYFGFEVLSCGCWGVTDYWTIIMSVMLQRVLRCLVLYYVKYSNEVSYSLSPEKLILMTQFWVVITQNTQIPMCA